MNFNLSETATLTIITILVTYILAPAINRFLSRKTDAAGREETFARAAELTVKNVLLALEEQAKKNIELEKRIETLEEALNLKNGYIDALEREIAIMKEYLKRLLGALNSKGIEFDPPPDGLLDTDPKIMRVKKK
jgi:hypothetical protein